VHLHRAQILDEALAASRQVDIEKLCEASLGAALPVQVSISIDSDPNIDPASSNLFQTAVALYLLSKTQSHWKWRWSSSEGDAALKLYIDKAEAISTTVDDLSSVSSKYLSHYEDVPNPAKSVLETQLSLQKISLEQAESRYEYAVRSHNAYPTVYSLQTANNAYTSYKMALNTYNSLVTRYNLTPSTVSRPVHLPYTFIEGMVRIGWAVDVTTTVGDSSKMVTAESIESDFVRFGTRSTDTSAAYRRDDPISIDVSASHRIEQLGEVCAKILDSLSEQVLHIPLETRVGLTGDEQILLNYVLHPFGSFPKQTLNEPNIAWGIELVDEIVLPECHVSPIPQQIAKDPGIPLVERTAKEIAILYEPLVCEITSSFGYGSGVLISGDGLVLTCAHVLLGTSSKAVFHAGNLKGEYELETIFTNEIQDVALVRAKGINSEVWAPIRMRDLCVKGEKIVAIGNPALTAASASYGNISDGIVSNQLVKLKNGLERLVCDITISQGSSGGPVVSMETGEVVGIVSQIVEAGIKPEPEVSTSGYSCLAVPAFMLTDWIGISYVLK
jgi:S1-C subfamily serine protease